MSLVHDGEPPARPKRLGWHALRFTPDARKVRVDCAQCGKPMYLPPSKVAMYQRCGPECSAASRRAARDARARPCETCDKVFVPRPWQIRMGIGRFCSQACNTAGVEAFLASECQARAKATMRAQFAAGLRKLNVGPDNHNWKGGKAAHLARRRDSGKQAAGLRSYRKRNPHKVREFAARRKSKKLGRLPRGTIPRIGEAQRWKCAICKANIAKGYHVDHVTPLAKGGDHAPRNIQLLCQSCNVRKNAKDPIDYMRSLGRLL